VLRPLEFGRGETAGVTALTGGRTHALEIVMHSRRHVQIELADPDSADTLRAFDGSGRSIGIDVISGHGRQSTDDLQIQKGRTPVFVVPDSTARFELLRQGKVVRSEKRDAGQRRQPVPLVGRALPGSSIDAGLQRTNLGAWPARHGS
jgi:hypothetical protein